MGRYIKLIKEAQGTYVQGRTQGYRMVVRAVESNAMPIEVFVFQRKPGSGADPDVPYLDEFTNIASPADLEEYPVGAPIDPNMPFFRLARADLVFRSEEIAAEAWAGILSDVAGLVEALNYMDSLSQVEEVIIGTPTPSSSSSSSQPSSSSGGPSSSSSGQPSSPSSSSSPSVAPSSSSP